MAAQHGRLREFHPETDTIKAYLERVSLYFTANEVQRGKQVAVLLSFSKKNQRKTHQVQEAVDARTSDAEVSSGEEYRLYKLHDRSSEPISLFTDKKTT